MLKDGRLAEQQGSLGANSGVSAQFAYDAGRVRSSPAVDAAGPDLASECEETGDEDSDSSSLSLEKYAEVVQVLSALGATNLARLHGARVDFWMRTGWRQ